MKFFSIFWGLILGSLTMCGQQMTAIKVDSVFGLSYMSVGLGGNIWEIQPMFRVTGSRFIYTLEEVWQFEGSGKAAPDTLLIGDIRASSIDSILSLAAEIKGDSVYKLNARIMSGGIIYLDIVSTRRKLNFRLDNSFDLIAMKIVDILNSYIPDRVRKLWISDVSPQIIEIK